MNLIIDAGNTAVKLAVFDKAKLIAEAQTSLEDFDTSIDILIGKHSGIKQVIISSVALLQQEQIDRLAATFDLLIVSDKLRTPFKNAYATPATLGADRIALAAAAVMHYPNKNVLVIDAGTCITYDIITKDRTYLGGAISPGMHMRFESLHHFTSRLPKVPPAEFPDFVGDSTENSILSGVINGLCMEIEGVIGQYESRYEHLTVILTGGDAQFLSNRLKKAIFAHSNFLLEGLNFLLEYNKQ